MTRTAKTRGKVVACAQEAGGRYFCAAEFEDGIVLFCELDGSADLGDDIVLAKAEKNGGSCSFFASRTARTPSLVL